MLNKKGTIIMTKSLIESMERLAEITALKDALENESKELKAKILKQMVKSDEKKLESDKLTVTYVAPTTRTTFDSKQFGAEHPKMYKEFLKTSSVSESLRVTLK